MEEESREEKKNRVWLSVSAVPWKYACSVRTFIKRIKTGVLLKGKASKKQKKRKKQSQDNSKMSSLYWINHLFGLPEWPGEIEPNTKSSKRRSTDTCSNRVRSYLVHKLIFRLRWKICKKDRRVELSGSLEPQQWTHQMDGWTDK